MSFSAETKNELARVISNDDYCNMTELAAIVRLAGSIQIAGYRKLNLKITTQPSACRANSRCFSTNVRRTAGYTATRMRSRPWRSNLTTPSTLENRVQSRPIPTFSPAWNLVPTWRTRMEPADTSSPAKRLTPRILGLESRPLRVEPCPFLCAMTLLHFRASSGSLPR